MGEKTPPIPTHPAAGDFNTQPNLVVRASYEQPDSKAVYVHRDLVEVIEPWAIESHIKPMTVTESFGDITSFVTYIQTYGGPEESPPFLSWNAQGFRAVLDYANLGGEPGRCQWVAQMPFVPSRQWRHWTDFASGRAVSQRDAVERLEDYAEDIVDPFPGDLMNLLRSLRASVNAKADAELRPDGTTAIQFNKETNVKAGAGGSVDLPPVFKISIPALKGHVDSKGNPVVYGLNVRLRASVDDAAKLSFRFSMPTADRVLEDAYADLVAQATVLLGETTTLLRGA